MKLTTFTKSAGRLIILILLCCCGYILVYIPNSKYGGYWGQPVPGGWSYTRGLSFHTAFLWQPYFGYSDNYNHTVFGLLFYPLIRIDQQCIHPPIDLANTNDAESFFSKDNHVRWHPEAIKDSRRLYMEKSVWRSECVDDREYCLQSARNFHARDDVHFISLLLLDKYGTNAVVKLQSLSEKEESSIKKRHISNVIDEIHKIEVDGAK